jgi:hypothetical protein
MMNTGNDLPRTVIFPKHSRPENIISTPQKIYDDLLLYTGVQERAMLRRETQKKQRLLDKKAPEKNLMAQVFFPQDPNPTYTEDNSKAFVLPPNQWQEIICDIPDPAILSTKGLRLDPLNTNGVINISSIKLVNKATGEALFQAEKPADFQNCKVTRHGFVLLDQECFTIFSYNFDPQLILPIIPNMPDCPIELRIRIKVGANQEVIKDDWRKMLERLEALSK